MYRPRIVPVLLISNGSLYKTRQFRDHRYIGDPLNAVRIFESFRVDELVFLDTFASKSKKPFSLELTENLSAELSVPFSVGGCLNTLRHIELTLRSGAERVILGSVALNSPVFVSEAVKEFGGSSVAVCVDIKRNWKGDFCIFDYVTKRKYSNNKLVEHIKKLEGVGVGELIVQSVDYDGMMIGYDTKLMLKIAAITKLPILAVGGASTYQDITRLTQEVHLNGYGASSMFIYSSKLKGVLINYPDAEFKRNLLRVYHEASL